MIYGGIAQLGERLNGIQEVSGSIPLISTTSKEIDWSSNESWDFIESLAKETHHVPWKLNIVIMMQLWEGNSKGNFFSVSISKLRWVKIQFLAKKLLETWACIIQLYREPIGLSMSWLVLKSERSEHLVFVLFTNQKPSESGFWFERRNDEARERITQGVS